MDDVEIRLGVMSLTSSSIGLPHHCTFHVALSAPVAAPEHIGLSHRLA